MTVFLLKRLVIGFLTLAVASMVVFAVMELLPGDPARLMLGMNATAESVAALRTQMGLDYPILIRYLNWAGGMLVGDFGRSFTYSAAVIDLIAERAVVSLPLGADRALPIHRHRHSRRHLRGRAPRSGRRHGLHGCRPGRRRGAPISGSHSCWSMSSPSGCNWCRPAAFPAGAAASGPVSRRWVLPAVALALPQAAILARVTRSAMLEVLGEDYIRTARAKGYAAPLRLVAPRAAQSP